MLICPSRLSCVPAGCNSGADGSVDAFRTSIGESVSNGLAIPQTGSLAGAAYLLDGNTIIRFAPSGSDLVADPQPWTGFPEGWFFSLVHTPSGSFLGEGLVTLDAFAGKVRLIRPDTSSTVIAGGLVAPVDLDLSEDGQSLLILGQGRGQILRLRAAP